VGPRAGLDRGGKSRPPPGFDPRTVQPGSSVAIPTELPGPSFTAMMKQNDVTLKANLEKIRYLSIDT
jgi:hypothetical protein